jgi:murein tripeptide amidase MpaA
MTIAISCAFDSGSIEVLALDGAQADLAIRHDLAADGTRSEFLQWFHFRVSGAERDGARLRIVNAGQTTYAAGWRDYRAVASWDRRRWERIPTAFDGEVMTIELPPAPGPWYVAYFEPYSWERHLALLADSCARGAASRRLGATVQERDVDALVVGEGAQPVWSGSSDASIRARRWRSGSSRGCWRACSTRPTRSGARCDGRRPFTSSPT